MSRDLELGGPVRLVRPEKKFFRFE